MASISPIIRANRATANDTVPIQIRVTYKRNSCKINIGHRIKQRDWDDEKKRVKKSHDNSVRLNNLIQNFDVTKNIVTSKLKGLGHCSYMNPDV